ncbi:MAG: PAS domain S-box protein [Chloroflexales bacterium]|nr:PAS domain S-box protein [Chloroflexales bacterium]
MLQTRLVAAERAVQVCQREIDALHRIAALGLREQPLRVALEEVVQAVSAATGFPIVAIEFYDEARQLMELVAATGITLSTDQAGLRVPVAQTISGGVARSGQAAIEPHAQHRPEEADTVLRQLGAQTVVCVPLPVTARVLGTLTLAHPSAIPLDADLVPLAYRLATLIAALVARRQAEEGSTTTEQQLRTILDKLVAGVTLMDTEGRFRFANQRAAAMFGLTPPEVIGKALHDLLPPDVAQTYLERNRRFIAARDSAEYEATFDLVAGRRTFFIADQVLTDAQGVGTTLLSSSIDITARTQAEAALGRSEACFTAAFHGSPIAMSISRWDDSTLVAVNSAFLNLYGYREDEVLGQTTVALQIFASLDDRSDIIQRLLAEGSGATCEMTMRTRAGVERIILLSVEPITIDGVAHLLSTRLDITARKQMEDALRESERKLRTLVEILPVGVFMLDAERRVAFANPALAQLLDLDHEALLEGIHQGRSYLRPDGAPMPLEEFPCVRALAEQRAIDQVEIGVVTDAGRVRWAMVSAVPVTFADWRVVIVMTDISVRKATEEALRHSERAFRTLYESMRDAFVSVDMQGTIRQHNRSFQELLGYSGEELAQLTYEDITPAQWHAAEARIVQEEILPQGYSAVYEKEYRRKDGTIVPIELRTVLTHDDQGQPAGMWAIIRDITTRRQVEERLQRLQEVTASFAATETLPEVRRVILDEVVRALGADRIGIRKVTPEGLVLEDEVRGAPLEAVALRQARVLSFQTSHPANEAVRSGSPVFIRDAQEFIQRYPDWAASVIGAPSQASAHLPLRRGDELFGVLTVTFAEPRLWDAGERTFTLTLADRAAVAYERARLFEAEYRARERSERLQAVTAALSRAATPAEVYAAVLHHGVGVMGGADADPALVAHTGTFFVLAGETLTLASASGFTDSQLAQYQTISLATPVPAAHAVRTARPVWLRSQADYIRQYPHLEAQIRQLVAEAAVSLPLLFEDRVLGVITFTFAQPLAFDAGEQGFLRMLADQAAQALERSQLFASLQEAVLLREQFLSVASHELRTPLTSVLGHAQLFQRRAARAGTLNQRDQRSLEQIITHAERLSRMITTILDVSRIDQGRLQLACAPLELTALLRETVTAAQGLAPHQIVVAGAEGPLWVYGDALRLEQALHNLLGNAIKYSPDGDTVTVTVTADADTVQVAVRDEGIGIPAADVPHIFERFYRAGNVSADTISGVGIGLFVVQEIVTLHGGTITVASAAGEGSTFTLTLPLVATPGGA